MIIRKEKQKRKAKAWFRGWVFFWNLTRWCFWNLHYLRMKKQIQVVQRRSWLRETSFILQVTVPQRKEKIPLFHFKKFRKIFTWSGLSEFSLFISCLVFCFCENRKRGKILLKALICNFFALWRRIQNVQKERNFSRWSFWNMCSLRMKKKKQHAQRCFRMKEIRSFLTKLGTYWLRTTQFFFLRLGKI